MLLLDIWMEIRHLQKYPAVAKLGKYDESGMFSAYNPSTFFTESLTTAYNKTTVKNIKFKEILSFMITGGGRDTEID